MQALANLCGNAAGVAQIAFRKCEHGAFHAEISQNLQMFFGLRHPTVVCGDNKQRKIN